MIGSVIIATQLVTMVVPFLLIDNPVAASHVVPSWSIESLTADVSQAYMQWSQWQHDRFLERMRNISKNTNSSHMQSRLTSYLPAGNLAGKKNLFDSNPESERIFRIDLQRKPEYQQRKSSFVRHVVGINESKPSHTSHNRNKNTSAEFHNTPYSTGASVILAILTAVVSLITIAGNVLVLVSFFVERALRTATNFFIASLAVTDVLIGIFSMNFYTLYLILGRWPLGRLSCDLWLSLDYTACLTSQYTVLIITVDRFCSVRLPAKYHNWRTDCKVIIMIAVTWIVPSSVFFPTIMAWPYFNSNTKPRPQEQCYVEFANDPVFNTIFTLCYFWVALCVMIGLYVGIYKVAEKLQKRSDEKRNRVSGLLVNQTRTTNTSVVTTKGADTAGSGMTCSSTRPNLPHSSSSLAGANESSGFDSEEENRKQSTAKQSGFKAITDNLTTHTAVLPTIPNSRPTTSAQKLDVRDRVNNNLDLIVSSLNGTPPKAETKVLNDLRPATMLEPMPVSAATTAQKLPVHELNSKSSECPVHRKCSQIVITNGFSDTNSYSPSSVALNESERLHISSPVLTDEDSGLEVVDELETKLHPIYLPPSPALCICADLEEERTVGLSAEPTGQAGALTEDDEAAPPNAVPENPIGHAKTTSSAERTREEVSDLKPHQSRIPFMNSSVDPGYHDRVMETYRRRMAANNLTVSVGSHDSAYLTSSNLSTQPSTDVCKSLNLNDKSTSLRQGSSSGDTNESAFGIQTKAELRNFTPYKEKPNAYQSLSPNCMVAKPAGKANDQSPIWKPQPYSEMDTFSTTCSLHGLICYGQTATTECYEGKNECILCARQQDSDSIHSSSSYAEYVGPNLIERRCCCCSIGVSDVRHKPVKQKTTLDPSIIFHKVRNFNLAVIGKLKTNLSLRKGKTPIQRGRKENRARKALRTITFILGAFVLCWTPYHVVIMIKGICDDVIQNYTCVSEILYSVTYWLCYMNSPINPFCYALANAQFKKTFLRIFHGDFRRT